MVPRSPSEHATDLVFEQSRNEVMNGLFAEIEQTLAAHAAFDQWLASHSCEKTGKSPLECDCDSCRT